MNSGFINIKNVSLVTMLAAASAAAIFLLNSPQKTDKEREKIALKASDALAIEKTIKELEAKHREILEKFDKSNPKEIPKEMVETMEYISTKDPSKHPPQIRLLCSQLIQDYAAMYKSVEGQEPDHRVFELCRLWLDFQASDSQMQIELINHRYALTLRSRSVKEIRQLYKWLREMDERSIAQSSVHLNWMLRTFQSAAMLGMWNDVLKCGRQMEKIDSYTFASQPIGRSQIPPHPLDVIDYIALKLPNQSANFTQVYFNVERYMNWFDPRLSPPLKFAEWQILDCVTLLKFAFSTDSKRHEELQTQVKTALPKTVENLSKFLFVYGCLVQYPCCWIQVPDGKDKFQPAVLCGPWNDTEMELTTSFVRKRSSEIEGEEEEKKQEKDNMTQISRSDLRLHLDRCTPSLSGSLRGEILSNEGYNDEGREEFKNNVKKNDNNNDNNDNDNYHEMAAESQGTAVGWIWRGTFEHEEGIVEIKDDGLSNFEFRRDFSWKEKALKCTCRTWDIQMIISTPD